MSFINAATATEVATWIVRKWRGRAADAGHFTAATAMRKQGIPLDIARAILFGRN